MLKGEYLDNKWDTSQLNETQLKKMELEDLIYSFILLRHKLGEPHNVWFKAVFGHKLPLHKRYQWV